MNAGDNGTGSAMGARWAATPGLTFITAGTTPSAMRWTPTPPGFSPIGRRALCSVPSATPFPGTTDFSSYLVQAQALAGPR